jgi:hypothetical protein
MKKAVHEPINLDDIKACIGFMSPINRINHLLTYLKISRTEIAQRHGCSNNNVTLVLSGSGTSVPVQNTIYRMLIEKLGDDCPPFELIFDTEIKEVCNG